MRELADARNLPQPRGINPGDRVLFRQNKGQNWVLLIPKHIQLVIVSEVLSLHVVVMKHSQEILHFFCRKYQILVYYKCFIFLLLNYCFVVSHFCHRLNSAKLETMVICWTSIIYLIVCQTECEILALKAPKSQEPNRK